MGRAPQRTNVDKYEIFRRTSTGGIEELFYFKEDGTEVAVGASGGSVPHAATHAEGGSDEIVDATPNPSTQAFGDAATPGATSTKASPVLHKHGMMADPVPPHVAAGDPHTQYTPQTTFNAHHGRHDAGGADAMVADAAAATASLRTLGSGALQAAAGNDGRFSDARTPTAHASTHNAAGSDVLAIDAAAATGSLRTLGSGATQAVGGTDARLSDARTPTAHHASHESGGTDTVVTKYAAGASYTIADGECKVMAKRQILAGVERLTQLGTSRLVIL